MGQRGGGEAGGGARGGAGAGGSLGVHAGGMSGMSIGAMLAKRVMDEQESLGVHAPPATVGGALRLVPNLCESLFTDFTTCSTDLLPASWREGASVLIYYLFLFTT